MLVGERRIRRDGNAFDRLVHGRHIQILDLPPPPRDDQERPAPQHFRTDEEALPKLAALPVLDAAGKHHDCVDEGPDPDSSQNGEADKHDRGHPTEDP